MKNVFESEKNQGWLKRNKVSVIICLIFMIIVTVATEGFGSLVGMLFVLNSKFLIIMNLCKGKFCIESPRVVFVILIGIESFLVSYGIIRIVRRMKKNIPKDSNLRFEKVASPHGDIKNREKSENWFFRNRVPIIVFLILLLLVAINIEILFIINAVFFIRLNLCEEEFCGKSPLILYVILIGLEFFVVWGVITKIIQKIIKDKHRL